MFYINSAINPILYNTMSSRSSFLVDQLVALTIGISGSESASVGFSASVGILLRGQRLTQNQPGSLLQQSVKRVKIFSTSCFQSKNCSTFVNILFTVSEHFSTFSFVNLAFACNQVFQQPGLLAQERWNGKSDKQQTKR